MKTDSQISAHISPATRELLERYVRATGMKKGQVIETALLHYLQASQELPADIVVHPRMVVTRRSGEEILNRISAPRPTAGGCPGHRGNSARGRAHIGGRTLGQKTQTIERQQSYNRNHS